MLLHTGGTGSVPLWAFEPVGVFAIAVLLVLFLSSRSRLASRGRRIPAAQTGCFVLALALLVTAALGPVPALSDDLLTAHMLQHVLIADLAPPLLLLGFRSPVLQFLWPASIMKAVARRGPLRRLGATLTYPPLGLSVWLLTVIAWHLPAAYDAAVAHPLVHIVQHVTFFLSGMLAWWPLLEPTNERFRGRVWKAGYIILARAVGGTVGLVLIAWPEVVYRSYAAGGAHIGIDMGWRADQRAAGAMMMTVDFAIVAIAAIAFLLAIEDDPGYPETAHHGERRNAMNGAG